MRGKVHKATANGHAHGITPAYAGKRTTLHTACGNARDHPRVCGEKSLSMLPLASISGSPPRMRGKGFGGVSQGGGIGITPAYAGKSCAWPAAVGSLGDHPRVCGEKWPRRNMTGFGLGSPPRMRGKVPYHRQVCLQNGITPAYAGKSSTLPPTLPITWDHPRVCGEKDHLATIFFCRPGSPPRMRGKGQVVELGGPGVRITPAYAGKSAQKWSIMAKKRDHPRVCGEKGHALGRPLPLRGSPPRMRGKVLVAVDAGRTFGITPAYAGKSVHVPGIGVFFRDHPRVCGEKFIFNEYLHIFQGSPPRMRGKVRSGGRASEPYGITPAYAGKRVAWSPSSPPSWDHPRVCGEKQRWA